MESYVTTFRGRAEMIEGLMRSPSTAFVVITSPDDAVLEDAAYFAGRSGAGDTVPGICR